MESCEDWLDQVQVKEGVSLIGIEQEIITALKVLYYLYFALGKTLTVTSTFEGQHRPGSLHYKGLAVDLRVWNLSTAERKRIVEAAKGLLGKDYDVIDETNHIHVEFDRKC